MKFAPGGATIQDPFIFVIKLRRRNIPFHDINDNMKDILLYIVQLGSVLGALNLVHLIR